VRVLEARRVGHGASGRNGGFALRGTAAAYDGARLPDVMRLTEEALGRIRDLAGDAFRGVGSLRVAVDEDEVAALRREHDALAEDAFAVEWRERDELPAALHAHALAGVFHPTDGALDQGRWVRRLAALASEAGALIAERTPVRGLADTTVRTSRGDVSADQVVLATDGYGQGLVPELDARIVTFRGQVLATEPLRERLLPCPVYARWGYDYAQQLADGRVVIGGRRDVDLDGEVTRDERPTEEIQTAIERHLRELVGDAPKITHRWAGLMGFTADFLPLVGALGGRNRVWASLGYSGHGNVLGFACGEAVAEAILGSPDPRIAPFSPGRTPAAPPPE
jgi:gamma-glutamylputrescine oxidase